MVEDEAMGADILVARSPAILYMRLGDLHNGRQCMGAMCNGVPLRQTPVRGCEAGERDRSESGESDPLESVLSLFCLHPGL